MRYKNNYTNLFSKQRIYKRNKTDNNLFYNI